MIKRIIKYILFFGVFAIVYGGMNYYLYWNLTQVFLFEGYGLIALRLLFWLLGGAYLITQLIKRKRHLPGLSYLGAAWMGVLSISLTVFMLKDIILFFVPVSRQLAGRAAFGISGFLILLSLLNVSKGPKIKRVPIVHQKLKGKKASLVLLSDVHLGSMTTEAWLKGIVEKINQLKPDFVVITGDLVDDSFAAVEKFAPIMKNIKSRYGTFAVAGNHEHYQGIDNFIKFLEAADITLLNDQYYELANGINLIGIDDLGVSRFGGLQQRLEKIIKDCSKEQFNILLIHQPVGFHQAAEMGVDLQLSGHTHRGQIPPLNLLVYLFYPYAYGLKGFQDSFIYTTSGTGTWGPPMRLFSDCEIVFIEIN
ncbi:metallophosphoesterase [Alkaliphilus crotonatoxidans]